MISATQKITKIRKDSQKSFHKGSFVKVRNQSLKVEGAAPQGRETTLHKSWFYFAHSRFKVI
jgi:hypothetical protein